LLATRIPERPITFYEFRGVPGALTMLMLIEDAKEPSNEARFDQ
jgi:hypothetical protein